MPTEKEKLVAKLNGVAQRIPVGFQLGMPMHLKRAIAEVDRVLAEHELPLREELLEVLATWRTRAEEDLAFAHECDRLMQLVIDEAGRD